MTNLSGRVTDQTGNEDAKPAPLAHMARAVTAPRLRDAEGGLPLNPNLAAAFPWVVELAPDRPQIPLTQLADVRHVNALSSAERQLCWAAVRVAIDSEVKYGELPRALMDAPVGADAEDDVRSFLSVRGWSRNSQPQVLTIGHARAYIGRRTNRLFECLPSKLAITADLMTSQERIDARVITPPAWFEPDVAALPAIRKAVQRGCGDALSEEERKRERAAQRAEHRRSSLEDAHWHESRLHQSEEVCVVDDAGLQITAQDPRLGRTLLALSQYLSLTGQPASQLRQLVKPGTEAARLADELCERLASMYSQSAADEVRDLLTVLLPQRPKFKRDVERYTLVEPRYGLDGKVMKLAEVGETHGLTRERVRQLQELFEARLSAGTLYAPRLQAARTLLLETTFLPLALLRERLAPVLGSMAVEGAIDLMERVLGWPIGGRIAYGRRNPLENALPVWTHSLSEATVSAVMQQAYAMSTMAGAFLVTTLIGLVAENAQRTVSRAQVHDILAAWTEAHWIDELGGWGWVDGVQRSPIVADVRKMLAVAQPLSVDIEELYSGLTRSHRLAVRGEKLNRFSGLLAPAWVIQALLTHLPEFQVAQQDNFRLRAPVDADKLMDDGTEIAIYREMKRHGGIASWQQLKTALVDEQGVNPVTFGVIFKNRCWVDQPGYGIYSLRGYRLLIEQIRVRGRVVAFPPNAGLLSVGPSGPRPSLFDGDGCVQFVVRMTSSTKQYRVINLPERFTKNDALVGYYRDTAGIKEIKVGRTQISGIADQLADAGVAAGTAITLWLDPAKKAFRWERVRE